MTLAPIRDLPGAGTSELFPLCLFGDRPALLTGEGSLSYRDLDERVAAAVEALGPVRRLVLIGGDNHVESLVMYLAALRSGSPALLVPGDNPAHLESATAAYDPDVVFARSAGAWQLTERRGDSAHDLHPDLALLLTTSGSTGSPKLVRLSRDNLRSNARASPSSWSSAAMTEHRPRCPCTTATGCRSSTAT